MSCVRARGCGGGARPDRRIARTPVPPPASRPPVRRPGRCAAAPWRGAAPASDWRWRRPDLSQQGVQPRARRRLRRLVQRRAAGMQSQVAVHVGARLECARGRVERHARTGKRPGRPARTPTSPDAGCRRTSAGSARRPRPPSGARRLRRRPDASPDRVSRRAAGRAARPAARPCAPTREDGETAAAIRAWYAGRTVHPASWPRPGPASPAPPAARRPSRPGRFPRRSGRWRGTTARAAAATAPAAPATAAARPRSRRRNGAAARPAHRHSARPPRPARAGSCAGSNNGAEETSAGPAGWE